MSVSKKLGALLRTAFTTDGVSAGALLVDSFAGQSTPSSPLDAVVETSHTEIVGYRSWSLRLDHDGDPCLYSPFRDTQWDGPSLTAHETPRVLQSPRRGVRYSSGSEKHPGIHAHHEPWEYLMRRTGPMRVSSTFAYGAVALSGIVLVGTYGLRAERATIQRLAFYIGPEDWAANLCPLTVEAALECRYQCEVEYQHTPPGGVVAAA